MMMYYIRMVSMLTTSSDVLNILSVLPMGQPRDALR